MILKTDIYNLTNNLIAMKLSRFFTLLLLLITVSMYAQDETLLDQTFAGIGYQTFEFSDRNFSTSVITSGDKTIVAIVTVNPDQTRTTRILQFNEDGIPDETFGDNGEVVLSEIGGAVNIGNIILTEDSKILLIGWNSPQPFGASIYASRLLPDGTIDTDFGMDGVFTQDLGGVDVPTDALINSDGEIFICGSTQSNGGSNSFIMKLNSDGTGANNFSVNGTNVFFGSSYDWFSGLEEDGDGNVMAIGTNGAIAYVWKINSVTGAVVPEFADQGRLTLPSEGADATTGLAITKQENSDDLIVFWEKSGANGSHSSIKKYTSEGEEVNSFDENGDTENFLEENNSVYIDAVEAFGALICFGTSNSEAQLLAVNYDFGTQGDFRDSSPTFNFSVEDRFTIFTGLVEDEQGRLAFIANATDTLTGEIQAVVGRIVLGGIDFDSVNSVEENGTMESVFSIFPNPFNESITLNIQLTNANANVQLEVMSVTGQLLLSKKFSALRKGDNTVFLHELSKLTSGTYLVRTTIDGVQNTSRLYKI